MNCKPGDIAIVVRGDNAGGLLHCLDLIFTHPKPVWRARALSAFTVHGEWKLDGSWLLLEFGRRLPAGVIFAAADEWLRPLRGEPEENHEHQPNDTEVLT